MCYSSFRSSDDMTGQHQFSFLSSEETNHFSLNFKRMSNAHQGVSRPLTLSIHAVVYISFCFLSPSLLSSSFPPPFFLLLPLLLSSSSSSLSPLLLLLFSFSSPPPLPPPSPPSPLPLFLPLLLSPLLLPLLSSSLLSLATRVLR